MNVCWQIKKKTIALLIKPTAIFHGPALQQQTLHAFKRTNRKVARPHLKNSYQHYSHTENSNSIHSISKFSKELIYYNYCYIIILLNCSETALKIVRKKVVSVEARTRTSEAEITALLPAW